MSRVGDSKILHGTTDKPYGYVESLRLDDSVQETTASRGDGEIVAAEYYESVQTCQGEYIFKNEGVQPIEHVGDGQAITIVETGFSFYIRRATKQWAIGQWVKVNFEGVHYPHLGS